MHASPMPRWTTSVALAALLVALPSTLWRLLMIAGLLPGTNALRESFAGDVPYVLALSVVELGAALAVLAVARGTFDPLMHTLRLPRRLPAVVGIAGGAVITWLFSIAMVYSIAGGARPDQGLLSGGALAVMVAAYAPILAWGPLTVASMAGAFVPNLLPRAFGRARGAARP